MSLSLNSKTLIELSSFNEKLLNDKCTDPMMLKSKWWWRFKNALIVSSADFAGFGAGVASVQAIAGGAAVAIGGTGYVVVCGVGGAIVGAGASMMAYDALPSCSYAIAPEDEYAKFETLTDVDYIALYNANVENTPVELSVDNYEYNYIIDRLNIPTQYAYLKRVGEDHNRIVKLSYDKGLAGTKSASGSHSAEENEVICTVPPISLEESLLIDEMVCDDEFKAIQKNIVESVNISCELGTFDIDVFFDAYPVQSKRLEKVLKLYLSLYVEFPDDLDDIVEIANGYIRIIEENNEFTNSEKESIYSAIIVSLYSPQIWN